MSKTRKSKLGSVVKNRIKEFRLVPANELVANKNNWRTHPKAQVEALRAVLAEIGFAGALLCRVAKGGQLHVIDGHMRQEEMGTAQVPCLITDLNEDEASKLIAVFDPLGDMADRNDDALQRLLKDLKPSTDGFAALLEQFKAGMTKPGPLTGPTLSDRFLVPPFSILDTKQGYWQERKRAWLTLGLASEVGRDKNLLKMSNMILEALPTRGGTSIFDPVVCEIAYRWFCPPKGQVLDPFAGGSVRGIVAAYLGFGYTGIDLRKEQVAENEKQAKKLKLAPRWITGDSRVAVQNLDQTFDLIFSCPPYFDLEKYSDDAADVSNSGTYEAFILAYKQIIAASVAKLNPNRFACFVVGDIRDKQGLYRNFVSDTIRCFLDSGMHLYNEIILATAIGTLPLRVRKGFERSRKVGKTHQNVLVFFKGDPRLISKEFPKLEIPDILEQFGEVL